MAHLNSSAVRLRSSANTRRLAANLPATMTPTTCNVSPLSTATGVLARHSPNELNCWIWLARLRTNYILYDSERFGWTGRSLSVPCALGAIHGKLTLSLIRALGKDRLLA